MRLDAPLAQRLFVRALFVALAATALLIGPGCLRRKFDLCLEDPPHPDCPRDAGPDATTPDASADDDSADAAIAPDGAADAPAEDAPSVASDAFETPDAP
jgi:hypothetical protein